MAQDVMQEYVVKLGTVIDNEGVNRILSFLDSSKVKALGLAGALAGVTTAVYKFIESATAHEFELAKLAKQQKKSIELTRAENNALKAMGKTMKEINADKDLKAVYKDIVAFNKEMEMPNMNAALDKVRNLEVAFTKLKSVINTAAQWINAQVLINLERPLDRITGKTQGFADWLKENMKNYAPKISTLLTDFAKGIMGIVEAGGKVLQWLNELPQAVKNVIAIVGVLIALIKGGTIGRLLVLIGLIGDILHDKDVYDWNKANGGNLPTLSEIWDIWYDEDLDPKGKAKAIATKIIEILNRNIKDAFKDFKMSDLFGDGKIGGKGIFADILDWFDENKSVLEEFGRNLLTMLSRGISAAGGIAGGVTGTIMNALFGDGTTSDYVFKDEDGSAGAALAGALGGFIYDFSEAMKKNGGNIFQSFKAGLKGATLGSIITDALSNIKEKDGKLYIDFESMKLDLSAVGESVINLLTNGIKTLRGFGSKLFEAIGGTIQNLDLGYDDLNGFATKIGGAFRKWAGNPTLMAGVSTSVTAALTGANFWESILSGVVGSLFGATDETRGQMRKYLSEKTAIPLEEILKMDDKTLEKVFGNAGGKGTMLTRSLSNFGKAGADFIEGIFDVLLQGAKSVSGISQTLWGKIVETLGSILSVDMSGSGDSIFGGMITTAGATFALGGNFIQALLASITTGLADLNDKHNGDLGTGIREEAQKFWHQLQLIWYGEYDKKTGKFNAAKGKGLHSIFEDLFGTGDTSFVDTVMEWLKPIGDKIEAFFTSLWERVMAGLAPALEDAYIAIYNLLPDWAKGLMGNDPNYTKITKGEDGKYSVKSSNNRERELTDEEASVLMTMFRREGDNGEINEDTRFNASIDAKGNIIPTGNGFGSNVGNPEYFKNLVAALQEVNANAPEGAITNQADILWKLSMTPKKAGIYDEITNEGKLLPDKVASEGFDPFAEAADGATDSANDLGDSLDDASVIVIDYNKNTKDAAEGASNAADSFEEATSALSEVAPAITNAVNAINKAAALASKRGTEKAWGGRIGSEGVYTVGEDGPEYIIPITKRERAMDLINQMFSEMGMGALNRASNDFGIGGGASFGTLGGSLDSIINGIGGNTNISAPINIYVTATGADGKEIGESAYDAAERHLVRTLRGVCA